MKKLAGSLFIAFMAGALTLAGYVLFFQKLNYIVAEPRTPLVTTSATNTSFLGNMEGVDFTVAAEKTVNAVVHVTNLSVSKPSRSYEWFYGSGRGGTPQVGTGSGVIISADGYIVTNNHVIANSQQLQVTLNNNSTYEAKLIGTDPNFDIALIKIEPDVALPYLAFGDSDDSKVGEWVLAVGNPFNLTSTVTAGIISAKARNLGQSRNQTFIQTDAAVNPGNSGGALVNINGDLIGINTAITSQTGSYVGYSFAVPSNIARKVVDDIMEYGNVQKGILGISAPRANTRYAIENGLNEIEGVYVETVEEDSGAADAGVTKGDIIKKIDRNTIRNFSELIDYINSKSPGDMVNLLVEREGEPMEFEVILKQRQRLMVPVMGLEVKNLTEAEKKKYKTDTGVKVTGVPEVYRGYGLEDKILVAIDGKEIKNIQDARNLFGAISRYGKTVITMLNENGEREKLIFQ